MYTKIKETPGGGACLFNSVAFGLLYYTNQKTSNKNIIKLGKILRKLTIQHLIERSTKNRDFKTMLAISYQDETNKSNKSISSNDIDTLGNMYIRNMKKSSTWGGNFEADILNKIIKKMYDFRGIQIIDENTNKKINNMTGSVKNKAKYPLIHVSLSHVNQGGCHFSFVIPEIRSGRRKSN